MKKGCAIVFWIIVIVIVLRIASCLTDYAMFDLDRLDVSDELEVVDPPEGFDPEDGQLQRCQMDGAFGVGSSKMMIAIDSDAGRYFFRPFTQDATIADFSWMMTRIYNEGISPKIRSGAKLDPEDLAIVDLAMRVQSAYVHVATVQAIYHATGSMNKVKDNAKSYYFHSFAAPGVWGSEVSDAINTLCLKWLEGEMGGRAANFGKAFSECDEEWLVEMIAQIRQESVLDIRWPNLIKDERFFLRRWIFDPDECVSFDFDDVSAFSQNWKEITTVVYFEAATCLQRMNKEITEALSRVSDVEGYPELHRLIEMWRPYVKDQVGLFCLFYADLPLLVVNKAAFDATTQHDNMFSTDRPGVKSVAAKYARATSDGKMFQLSCSATTGHLISQYHGYLKKLLGSGDYQNLINSIKWRKSDPLKYEQ